MLSLSKRRDYELVFKEGVNSVSKNLVAYARANELDVNRLGLSVSKKIGRAVIRNRIKRLIREAVKKISWKMPVGYDFVFIARKDSVRSTLDDFLCEIEEFIEGLKEKTIFRKT